MIGNDVFAGEAIPIFVIRDLNHKTPWILVFVSGLLPLVVS